MKISRYLRVSNSVSFNRFKKIQLQIQNKCTSHLYLVYTSYNKHLLFEIIESRLLTSAHKHCYLVAVASSKQEAIHYVKDLIDEIYNVKSINYEHLKR